MKTISLVLASLVSGAALAQTPIVPPPVMPGSAQPTAPVERLTATPQRGDVISLNLPAKAVVPPPAEAPVAPGDSVVIPAAQISAASIQPQANDVLNLADLIPLAPKPAAPIKAKEAKPAKKTQRASAPIGDAIEVVAEADPFAGLVTIPVSDSQLNRFVFPEPIEGVYFPEGAPLPECPPGAGEHDPCKPIFLNGRQMMLLQLRAGASHPFQVLVHTTSGNMVTLNLAPAKGPGAVVRIDGAEDGPSDTRLAARGATQGAPGTAGAAPADVSMISQFAKGTIPPQFAPKRVGAAKRTDAFDMTPMASWSDGVDSLVTLYQVRGHADTPVAISPQQFHGRKVRAVALDSTQVSASASAYVYILEQGK